jgi:hypothetical protein
MRFGRVDGIERSGGVARIRWAAWSAGYALEEKSAAL